MVDRISTSLAQQLGINAIMFQQAQVNQAQQQISLGKRILTPSDDPSGAAQVLDFNQSISRITQFQTNINYAENRLSLSDTTLQSVTNSLHRVRELAVQGYNDTNTAADRQSIANEMFQRLDEMVALANTKDANGDYLYSGFKGQTQAVTGSAATGVFSFQGDQGQRLIQIGENRTVSDNNSGAELFFNLQDKNGNAEDVFTTLYSLATDLATNSPALEETELTFNSVPLDAQSMTINGINYEFDDGTGPAIAPPSIAVDISAAVTGDDVAALLNTAVASNDSTVDLDQTNNTLRIIANTPGEGELAIDVSLTSAASATNVSIPLYDHLDQLDTALNRVLDVRSQIGARLNALDSQQETNQDFLLNLQSAKSQVEDLDMAEAISRFNLQIVSLQAAQQSFVKVQNLSLFNLL
ncbi:flagellar hook-associated protein FlgL [uncultured Cycloclasticus sp.]|uniref:flagellar hook-associated protein FlgL n=1 Tax=uncultured Cycloclasticus sp. TaxID=172194 RepID=UPI002590F4AC|nr:flagellar hook-associated protein FlgL [uncultured Cycloclasticus sp.]